MLSTRGVCGGVSTEGVCGVCEYRRGVWGV